MTPAAPEPHAAARQARKASRGGVFMRSHTERLAQLGRDRRGFTLIELGVSIAILVTIIGVVTVSISNIRGADLKKASGVMAASMRYLYNLAVINRTTYRLVIDLDNGEYWGEELKSEDPCDQFLADEDDLEGLMGEESEDLSEMDSGPATAADAPGKFSKPKDNLLTRRPLPKGIVVTTVMTSHHDEPQDSGRVAIHFFRGGYAEKAYIWMGLASEEDDGDPFDPEGGVTVSLESLMGGVQKHMEALPVSRFLREKEELEDES